MWFWNWFHSCILHHHRMLTLLVICPCMHSRRGSKVKSLLQNYPWGTVLGEQTQLQLPTGNIQSGVQSTVSKGAWECIASASIAWGKMGLGPVQVTPSPNRWQEHSNKESRSGGSHISSWASSQHLKGPSASSRGLIISMRFRRLANFQRPQC